MFARSAHFSSRPNKKSYFSSSSSCFLIVLLGQIKNHISPHHPDVCSFAYFSSRPIKKIIFLLILFMLLILLISHVGQMKKSCFSSSSYVCSLCTFLI